MPATQWPHGHALMPQARILLAVFVVAGTLAEHKPAQAAEVTQISTRDLTNPPLDVISLKSGWLYRAGDDPSWAQPRIDDSDWLPTGSFLTPTIQLFRIGQASAGRLN